MSRRAFSGQNGKKRLKSGMSESGLDIGEDDELAASSWKRRKRLHALSSTQLSKGTGEKDKVTTSGVDMFLY